MGGKVGGRGGYTWHYNVNNRMVLDCVSSSVTYSAVCLIVGGKNHWTVSINHNLKKCQRER